MSDDVVQGSQQLEPRLLLFLNFESIYLGGSSALLLLASLTSPLNKYLLRTTTEIQLFYFCNSPSCPETRFVEQAGFKLTEIEANLVHRVSSSKPGLHREALSQKTKNEKTNKSIIKLAIF